MISARRRFSAFSTATPLLRASCWKAPLHSPQPRLILVPNLDAYVSYSRTAGYSSIADAMLGRAVQTFQAPPPRKEALAAAETARGAQSPGSSQGVDDMLKNGTKNNNRKSISGWARPVSPSSSVLSSAPLSVFSRKNSASAFSRPTTAGTVTSTAYADTSSVKRGVSAGPGRQGFVGAKVVTQAAVIINSSTDIVDLTQEAPSKSHAPQPVEFDFDDFDDDSDLDLEVEYPLALPPLTSMPPPKLSATPQHLANPSSGPIPWSSSPQAHMGLPPGAGAKRSSFQEPEQQITNLISSEPSIDANPRPAKRRTTPWAQRAAEEKEAQPQQREQAARCTQCFKCQGYGHYSGSCTREHPKDNAIQHDEDSFTPLPKEKSLPWNTTASAIRDKRGAFREHQKTLKMKREHTSITEMFKTKPKASTKEEKGANIFLSSEQSNVLELVTQQKKSVFFTGSAGTGKSVLMRAIIAELRKVYKKEPDRVAVTASTGLAACNIGGVTLHSFGGIGLGKESVPDLVKKIMRNQKAKNRWLRTKVLVIDEVSMVDGELFDKLEGIARFIRKNGRPFGGIQLVVTGDFFQLPPVPDYGKQVKFAFDADSWSTSIHHTIGLTEVFRQRDPVFANMLNEMRLGKISDATMKAFRKLDRPLEASGLDATELFPTRNEVDNSNFMKMRQLQGAGKIYLSEDSGSVRDPQQLERLLQNFMAPKKLELKKHAQVMLIKNMDDNLVNGSIGKVIGFMNEKTFEVYEGVDLDPLDNNAVSETEDPHDATREAKRRIRGMMNKDLIADTGKEYPLVRFFAADGTSRDLLCQPEDWKVELPNGEIQAQRRQIPLILAWALSIHKAQGQTLERVKVDLRKVFENGQAYVALSRATTQEGLWVQNFNPRAVMAHKRVGEFYDSLYSVNKAMRHPKVQPEGGGDKKQEKVQGAVQRMEDRQMMGELESWEEDEEAMVAYG
ncbi:hypothetical protein GMDG_01654 [Pseudogymnoascus destructans 20631-21]|uniref:ATP-dependent DNA helicase PIF1 n=1 Tax=Pseudogymnoascus destructans (strain ATCC MYA-4855 / 20631-21) TaxID=658429 RepID=L8FZR6_PSED2|nr:hypothetical protein GMDG_01654 [Pseudogymnoascus destructans 20631-21]